MKTQGGGIIAHTKPKKPGTYSTTGKHFALFKAEATRLIGSLGLKDWDASITHEEAEIEGSLAECRYDYGARAATLRLCVEWGSKEPTDAQIRKSARHEVLEMLLVPIRQIALDADLSPRQKEFELNTEAHAIIHRLTDSLKTEVR